ncbi:MAG: fibronectin type III domain-containing protein, partial [Oscillospiraceae bacterium]
MKFKKVISFIIAAGMILSVGVMPSNKSCIAVTASAASATLAAPKNIKAAVGTDKITLKWDKVSGADAYRIYLYDFYNKKYRSVKTVTGTTAAITGLLSEQKYYFKICALKKSNGKYTEGEKYSFSYTTKSIGDKNIVLTEYYEPCDLGSKGFDLLTYFKYDKNGRIIEVNIVYSGSMRSSYEHKGEI